VPVREHAQSRCGTFDFIDHRPAGGDKKVIFWCREKCMTVLTQDTGTVGQKKTLYNLQSLI